MNNRVLVTVGACSFFTRTIRSTLCRCNCAKPLMKPIWLHKWTGVGGGLHIHQCPFKEDIEMQGCGQTSDNNHINITVMQAQSSLACLRCLDIINLYSTVIFDLLMHITHHHTAFPKFHDRHNPLNSIPAMHRPSHTCNATLVLQIRTRSEKLTIHSNFLVSISFFTCTTLFLI